MQPCFNNSHYILGLISESLSFANLCELKKTLKVFHSSVCEVWSSCTCGIWDYNFRLDNAGPCMKHFVDVYSEQLRISLKSEITNIYKWQIEEIQRLKLTPSAECVEVKCTSWILKVGLLISYLFSPLQWVCDPEFCSWETLWLHEEAERREPGLHLDPFCDPSTAWTWWASGGPAWLQGHRQ